MFPPRCYSLGSQPFGLVTPHPPWTWLTLVLLRLACIVRRLSACPQIRPLLSQLLTDKCSQCVTLLWPDIPFPSAIWLLDRQQAAAWQVPTTPWHPSLGFNHGTASRSVATSLTLKAQGKGLWRQRLIYLTG